MSITIVASLPPSRGVQTSADASPVGTLANDGSAVDSVFAKLLLALSGKGSPPPEATAEARQAEDLGHNDLASTLLALPGETPPPGLSEDVRDAAPAAPTAEAPLVAPLALPSSSTQQSDASGRGSTGAPPEIGPTSAPQGATLRSSATGPRPREAPALTDANGTARSSANGSVGDGKAAKIAAPAADFAVPTLVRGVEPRPEGEPWAGGGLVATLAPGSVSAGMATATLDVALPTPLRDPAWANDFTQKVLWIAGNDRQQAQLTLNPPHLGAIEITLKLDREGANAHFVSANADVRGAIESALPRLREMFASSGIELGQVSVGSESFRQAGDGQRPRPAPPREAADTAILGIDSPGALINQGIAGHRGSALVDIFA